MTVSFAKIEVEIDNVKVENDIIKLMINESMETHHSFEFGYIIIDKEINFAQILERDIGKSVKISIEQNSKTHFFKGVITKCRINSSIDNFTELIFQGYSPTILLDDTKDCKYFNDVKLGDIVKKITDEVPMNVKTNISADFQGKFKHFMQFRETGYNFLKRIASMYGEWFFYNGTELSFGGYNSGAGIELDTSMDLREITINAELQPLHFKDKYYDFVQDKEYTAASGTDPGLDSLGKKIKDKSNTIFSHHAVSLNPNLVTEQGDLKALVDARHSGQAGNLVILTAVSSCTELKIGAKIKIKDYGAFVVTHIHHTWSTLGIYENTFIAVPSSLKMPPSFSKDSITNPVCEIQNAKVVANNDPDDLGRVRVRYYWMESNEQTWWMRVMTSSSGKDKGFYFVPEIDDDVLVAFEDNNPNKPYVTGTVFHGKTKPSLWKNSKNYIKGLKTISGNEIFINDEGGKETIKIQQKDAKNEIVITLEGSGKITLTTKGDMVFKADKSISFEAMEEIKMKSTKGTTMEALDFKVTANKNLELKATAEAKLDGLNVTVNANVAAAVKGSATAEISSTGQTTVKGTIVMIN